MLEIISAPDTVVAFRISGQIDEVDIERGYQAVEEALARHDRVALYVEGDIGGMTLGALAKDFQYALGTLREIHRFPRAAVVTGQDWVRWIAWVEGAVLPGIEMRVFSPSEKDAAMAWVSEPLPARERETASAEPAIQLIETSKPGMIAFDIRGRVGADDARRLISIFEDAMNKHERLRVLVRVTKFDGVSLEVLRQEGLIEAKMQGWKKVERSALVGGPTWLRTVTEWAAPIVPIDTRWFDLDDEAQAWNWIEAEPAQAAGK
jgi:hypothetical protein